jgi:predicted nucleic-acid-binding Zn-ribbon protein
MSKNLGHGVCEKCGTENFYKYEIVLNGGKSKFVTITDGHKFFNGEYTITYWNVNYTCKKCGHKWSEEDSNP